MMTKDNSCACGCGQAITLFDSRNRPRKYIHGHNNRGMQPEQHGHWQGGKMVNTQGYILIRSPNHVKAYKHGLYMPEHIITMEKHIGRYLHDYEVVHHKDHNRQNNNIDNLQLMTRAEHQSYHRNSDWRDQRQ